MKSLHIGLNAVDPRSYGAAYELNACEADAMDMRALAHSRGSEAKTLLTEQATCDAVLQATKGADGDLASGDLYFIQRLLAPSKPRRTTDFAADFDSGRRHGNAGKQ